MLRNNGRGLPTKAARKTGGVILEDDSTEQSDTSTHSIFDLGGSFCIGSNNADPREAELLTAAMEGRLEGVQQALAAGADIATADWRGLTALHRAACAGETSVVQYLVEQGVNKEAVTKRLKTPLRCAVEEGHMSVVQYLVGQGADTNSVDAAVLLPRYYMQSDPSAMQDGLTPLLAATDCADLAMVQCLVDHGANVEAQDTDKQTALMYAVTQGHKNIVDYLLDRGVETKAMNEGGNTALQIAATDGKTNCVQPLVSCGANVHHVNTVGDTALILAAEADRPDFIKCLIEHGANIESVNEDGVTALIEAARRSRLSSVQSLVSHGANLEARTKNGQTALFCASDVAIVHLLASEGANVDAADKNGKTPLIEAVMKKRPVIVKYLLEHGALVDLKNKRGKTAIDFAKTDKLKRLLLEHMLARTAIGDDTCTDQGIISDKRPLPTPVASKKWPKAVKKTSSPIVEEDMNQSTVSLSGDSFSAWVSERLTKESVESSKVAVCLQLLLANDVTSGKIFGSLSLDEVTEVIASADPKLTPGMRRVLRLLYEEAHLFCA